MSFKLGEIVTWTSQAQGGVKTKTGTIEEVVAPGGSPSRERFSGLYTGAGVGGYRNHVSYVVRVPGKTPASKGTVYWPYVSKLQIVTKENHEQVSDEGRQ